MEQKELNENSSPKEVLAYVERTFAANKPYLEALENNPVSDTEILDWIIQKRSAIRLREFKEPLMLLVGDSCFVKSNTTFRQDVRNAVVAEMKKESSCQ